MCVCASCYSVFAVLFWCGMRSRGWGHSPQNPNISYYMTRYRQQPMQMLDFAIYIFIWRECVCMFFAILFFFFVSCRLVIFSGYISQIAPRAKKNIYVRYAIFFSPLLFLFTALGSRQSRFFVPGSLGLCVVWKWTNCCRCCCFSDFVCGFSSKIPFSNSVVISISIILKYSFHI